MTIVTLEVLEAAYPRRRKALTRLTHSVELDSQTGQCARVLCNRVDLESVCDVGSLDPGDEQRAPTCPRCKTKDPRFQGSN